MVDPRYYKLAWALALSMTLHLVVLTPWSWPFLDAGRQTGMQVQISATLNARPAPSNPTASKQPNSETKLRSEGEDRSDRRRLVSRSVGPKIAAPKEYAVTPAGAAVVERDREATIVEQALPPEYPDEALRRGLESCVLAAVDVSPAGEVEKVEIIAADVPRVFDRSIIEAQSRARYLPARREGEAVASRVLAVAAFVLEPGRRLNCALKYAALAERMLGDSGTGKGK
jgi:TonB family protein